MLTLKTFSAALGLSLLAASTQAQVTATPAPERHYPKSSIGLNVGWGAPYGFGADFSYMVTPNLDLNAGLGLGVGFKAGVGTRYYFMPQRKLSPFVGLNLTHTTGIAEFDLTLNENTMQQERTRLSFKPSNQLHLRGGVRWQPTLRFAMIGALGYGARLTGNPVVYAPGYAPTQQSNRDLVDAIAPGGVEVSVGVAFGLGR
ncbi:hypothetical protein GCM10023185_15960 [Hymenobacter saemangeumensis]|uniref:Outer membrane protein beta-barrel domain-containing protein n=1 Tax=Hymenobacter saemangeumensis TaxID=1084522 RepID=A0ABP8I9M6_9BACT